MSTVRRRFVTVNALVLLTLVIGLVNNVLIAAVFGLTARVDAFFAAMTLPTLFMILCVDYLGKNFLPVFAAAKRESDVCASELTSTIVTIVMILAAVGMLLLMAFSDVLFRLLLPGFEGAEARLVNTYFWIMAPSIVLMAGTAFHEYVCQYDEQFSYVVAARMGLPAINLAAIALLGPVIGEYCLPIGHLAGHAFVFVAMARRARYRFRLRFKIRRDFERKVFANSAIVMSTGLVARSRSIIMNYFASLLGDGVISALALATKLTEPIHRSVFYAARMFMFNRTARLFAEKNDRDIERLYTLGLRASFLVLAPLLWWMGLNAAEIVDAFFAHGASTPAMTASITAILIALTPSVLFLGVNQLLSNAFYAMGRVKVPALIMPAGTLLYAASAAPLAAAFGAQGLALATTAVSITVFIVLVVCLSRLVKRLRVVPTLLRLIGYVALAGTLMFGLTAALTAIDAPGIVVTLATLPGATALYVLALGLAGDETSRQILGIGRGWLHRRAAVSG